MITDPAAIVVVLAAVVWVSVRLDRSYRMFRSLGSALVAILLAMALSNIGLLPGTSTVYDFLASTGVSVAIVLILLSVDVRSVLSAGPRMLAAFAIGAVGTSAGALIAGLTLHRLVGPETWKLSGQYTGTYTGGGVNFAALARAFDTSSDLFSAAVAADVGVTAIWLVACLALPAVLERARDSGPGSRRASGPPPSAASGSTSSGSTAGGPSDNDSTDSGSTAGGPTANDSTAGGPAVGETGGLQHSLSSSGDPVALADAAALVTLGIGLVWCAGRLATVVPVPEVLLLTTLVLVVAQLPPIKALAGSAMWGNYLLHLFLAANGAQSVIANIFAIGPAVFYFAVLTVAVHGIVIFGAGRAVGIDARTLAVASQANVGGPASAMALAGARGYTETMLPGIAVGLLGYAAGNYAGFVVAAAVRGMLGG